MTGNQRIEGSERQTEREVPGRFIGVALIGHWIEEEKVPHPPHQTGLQEVEEVWKTSVENWSHFKAVEFTENCSRGMSTGGGEIMLTFWSAMSVW